MRTITLLFILMIVSLVSKAQTATIKDVESGKYGSYTEYVTHNHSFKIGDTITVGDSKKDLYINVYSSLTPAKDIAGTKATIKSIDIKKKQGKNDVIIKTNRPFHGQGNTIILVIYSIDDAIKSGEIVLE